MSKILIQLLFNIRIFFESFCILQISFGMHKSWEICMLMLSEGHKEDIIDFINLSAKSSVLNYLWKKSEA